MSAAAGRIVGATPLQKISKPRVPAPPASTLDAVHPDRSIAAIAEAIARSQDQLRLAVAEAAYYRAQQRGFAPGHELEDWLAAQHEISGQPE